MLLRWGFFFFFCKKPRGRIDAPSPLSPDWMVMDWFIWTLNRSWRDLRSTSAAQPHTHTGTHTPSTCVASLLLLIMYHVPCLGGWILRRLISLMDLCLSNTWPWFKCVCLSCACARAGDCASSHLSGLTCTVTSTILQGVRCKASCSPPPRRPPGEQPSITKQPAGPQINISPAARGSAPDSSTPPHPPPPTAVLSAVHRGKVHRGGSIFFHLAAARPECNTAFALWHPVKVLPPESPGNHKKWPWDIRWHSATMIDLH